ncbi:Nn.00g116580.m01.CDS01 [Neocucurbitaria sp. VM-36]
MPLFEEYVAFEASSTLSDIATLPWYKPVVLASSSLSSFTATLTTYTTTPITTPTPSSAPTATTQGGRRAIAIGLGVGLGCGILILLGLVSYIRRQRKKHEGAHTPLSNGYPSGKGAVTDSVGPGYVYKAELDGTPVIDSCGSPAISELMGSTVIETPCQSPLGSPEMAQREIKREERMSACVEEHRGTGAQELPG